MSCIFISFLAFHTVTFPPPDRILFRRPCDIYLPGYGQFSFIPIYPQTIPWSECPLKMHLLKEGSVSQKGETVFLFLFSRSRCQKQSGRSSLFPFFLFCKQPQNDSSFHSDRSAIRIFSEHRSHSGKTSSLTSPKSMRIS